MANPVQQLPRTPPPPPRAKRMTLASITTGIVKAPYRVFVYGVDGVGKTVFGSHMPKPVFLASEDGTGQVDVARFPQAESFVDTLEAVETLRSEQHGYESLVVDTVDWLEPMIWADVIASDRDGAKNIEEVGGGYGKGYTAALDTWRLFLAALERLQAQKKMHVLLLGHAIIKQFKNPEGEDFDRYIVKLNEKAGALIREWVKGCYFANYETFAEKDKRKRVRGISSGARLLYTQRTAAYDAKDRYGVPYRLSLDWDTFDEAAKKATPEDPVALLAEIKRKAALLGGEIETFTTGWLDKYAGNAQALSGMNDRLNAKLGERHEAEEPQVNPQ